MRIPVCTKTILIHGNRHQNSNIFILSAPVAAHGNARQIHLDEGFLHAAFPAAIPFDDGSLEGYALEPRHVERDVAGGHGEIPVIVAAAIALTGLAALVAGGLCQGLRLLLQQLIQGFLHAATNQFLDLTLFGGHLPDDGKQLVVDRGNRDNGTDACASNGSADKLGLTDAVGRKAGGNVGVFLLAHACSDYSAAVGRVIASGYGYHSFLWAWLFSH